MRARFHYLSKIGIRSGKMSLIVVSLGFLIQLGFLFTSIIRPQVRAVWEIRELNSLERSAYLSFGDSFAEYISFLKEYVPQDATLVIPRQDVDYVLGHVGIMQYFLIPREIVNCAHGAIVEECIGNLGDTNTYILAVGNFPPREEALHRRRYISYDEHRGVYVPQD